MTEIIGKIVLCLVIALLLGFLIGWLFSKALQGKDKYVEDDEKFDELESQLHSDFTELEVRYAKEKAMVIDYAAKNSELKGELMKKIALLESTTSALKTLQSSTLEDQHQRGTLGADKITKLENLLAKKNKELAEFESVLIKAEETIEKLSK